MRGGIALNISPRTDATTTLTDGRRLGFAQMGDPRGQPLLYFHGFPGSRLEALLAHVAARRQGVRLIGVDRPGYGLSDPRPGRTLTDWPRDVTELASHLGLARFGVVGVSGGGPYALACAHEIPGRLTSVAVICGLGPLAPSEAEGDMGWLVRLGLRCYRRAPRWAGRAYGVGGLLIRAWPELLVGRLASATSPPHRRALAAPKVRRILARSFREAHRQGATGPLDDLSLYARPWDFRPADIRAPVRLWHGERDGIVPVSMGRALARAIPGCRATFHPDEGHFSLLAAHAEVILAEVRDA